MNPEESFTFGPNVVSAGPKTGPRTFKAPFDLNINESTISNRSETSSRIISNPFPNIPKSTPQPSFSAPSRDSLDPLSGNIPLTSSGSRFYDDKEGLISQNPAPQQTGPYDIDNEPPLLEDLGIDLQSIKQRAIAVLLGLKVNEKFIHEADMSGPILICMALGSLLLLAGKIHFGYIYGFGVVGSVLLYLLLNLLGQSHHLTFYSLVSVLGYCLFPMVALAASTLFVPASYSTLRLLLAAGAICWSAIRASYFFQVILESSEQRWIIAYPILLFYSTFVLIIIY
eukprot:TRINITY_DN12235_c0_g1_i2.p1 TRINITY_DN12235_c0_g1~~TRINITY_DN12235_c0_g1_i2.p1  ORF type:complete len:284 (-),score=39.95 TRINITY_DN12235_c0_g1_i2:759-1610(-)